MADYNFVRDSMLLNGRKPFHRMAKVTKNLPNGAAGAGLIKSFTVNVENGAWLEFIELKVPNFTNAITCTVTVESPDSIEIYNSTAKARNASYGISLLATPVALSGTVTVKLTFSGDPGGTGGDTDIVLYLG